MFPARPLGNQSLKIASTCSLSIPTWMRLYVARSGDSVPQEASKSTAPRAPVSRRTARTIRRRVRNLTGGMVYPPGSKPEPGPHPVDEARPFPGLVEQGYLLELHPVGTPR